jgi:glycosyltransferase involved in cell wall biosynthesis
LLATLGSPVSSAVMADAALHVLHVAQATTEGVGHFLDNATRDQAARGWRVTVATPPSERVAAVCAETATRHVEWRARRKPGFDVIAETRSLRRITWDAQPDVLMLHSSKAGLAGRLAMRGAVPTIFRPAAWSFLHSGPYARRVALEWERVAARHWTDIVLCVSEAERARGERARVRSRYLVVRNAVDVERFTPASTEERDAVRQRLGFDGPVAVCVGRLAPQKGQDRAIAAWPAVRARAPGARLVLVGDGGERAALARSAAAVEGVELVGPKTDVRDWLVAADVVVAPSRWEGCSFAVLEALACGRSVVATDVEGMREAVVDPPGPPAGAVVAEFDADAFTSAVSERLADADAAAVEGKAARERAVAWDLRRWGDALAAVVCEAAGRV